MVVRVGCCAGGMHPPLSCAHAYCRPPLWHTHHGIAMVSRDSFFAKRACCLGIALHTVQSVHVLFPKRPIAPARSSRCSFPCVFWCLRNDSQEELNVTA